MEKTYNPALIQRTQRYMETHSISQNQFAAKVNLSSAALSSYLNQKYKGSVEAVERQLSEFFKLDEEAEAAAEKTASLLPRAAYVPTSISEDVCQSIRFAQLEQLGYMGPYMIEMWYDAGSPDDLTPVRQAKAWLEEQFRIGTRKDAACGII